MGTQDTRVCAIAATLLGYVRASGALGTPRWLSAMVRGGEPYAEGAPTVTPPRNPVFGGMLTSAFLAVLFVPVFYVVFQGWSERRAARKTRTPATSTVAAPRESAELS